MPTLTDYRAALAVECGPYIGPDSYVVRATSGSDTTQLVCSQYPVRSSIPQQDSLIDRPLYRPTARHELDRHRYVAAYDPPTGTITPDLPWLFPPFSPDTGNTYEFLEGYTYGDLGNFVYEDLEGTGINGIGERFEVLGPFDAPTMHKLINDGLKQTWMVVDVPFMPTEIVTRHDLGVVAPWLLDANQVLQVGLLAAGENRNQTDPFARRIYGEVEHDGGSFYLNTYGRSFNATDTLFLRCLKRAYDHCRSSGGTYGMQSGLTLETDEAPIEREWLVSSALVVAWRRYAHLLEPAANARLIRDQAAATVWFADRTRVHLSAVKPQMTFTKARSFGPAHA